MRVRMPKQEGKKESKPTSKSKTKSITSKTRVDTTHERSRYLSSDLVPLSPYRVNVNENQRKKWYRSAVTYLRAFIAEGLSREEIKSRLGIDDSIFDQVEARLLEHDGSKFAEMGTAHRYYYYMLRMEQCSRELDDFINSHMSADPKTSGVVGAIKAKAQIYKDVMTMGQDLGIVKKRARDIRVLGELNLTVMPTDELRDLFRERMQWFEDTIQEVKRLPDGYSNILKNATVNAYEEADAIIDAEFSESPNEEAWEETATV